MLRSPGTIAFPLFVSQSKRREERVGWLAVRRVERDRGREKGRRRAGRELWDEGALGAASSAVVVVAAAGERCLRAGSAGLPPPHACGPPRRFPGDGRRRLNVITAGPSGRY